MQYFDRLQEVGMRAFVVSSIASLLIYAAMPPTDAAATNIQEADALCKKNPKCQTMERGEDGNIYCVRQAGGACKVVVCPAKKPCFVYIKVQTVKPGFVAGTAATTRAGIEWVLRRPKDIVAPNAGILDRSPGFSPTGPAATGAPAAPAAPAGGGMIR